MMRLGMIKCRVAETLDLDEVLRLVAQGNTLRRASEFLGVHWTTLARFARTHGLSFTRRYHYPSRRCAWPPPVRRRGTP